LTHAPRQKSPQAEKHDGGNDPGEQILNQRTLDLAGIGDPKLLKVASELRIDSRRHELLFPVWKRLFQSALYGAIGHGNPIDRAFREQLLKLTVRKRLDPLADRVKVLQKQNTNNGSQPIANVKLRLLGHARHRAHEAA